MYLVYIKHVHDIFSVSIFRKMFTRSYISFLFLDKKQEFLSF